MKKSFLTIAIILLAFGLESMALDFKVNADPNACGIVQPDAQLFPNCSGEPRADGGCKADTSQASVGGWLNGSDVTARKYKTSADNQLWMQLQCFETLSYGRGGTSPARMLIRKDSGSANGQIIGDMTRPNGNTTALKVRLPSEGTYTGYCYTGSGNSCLASKDTFTVYPRCSVSKPGAAALIFPENNSSVTLGAGDSVITSFDLASSGWGAATPAGCSNILNNWQLEYQKNCTGTWTNAGATNVIYGLQRGATYCWRVLKNNQTGTANQVYSATSRFTVLDDSTQITSSGLAARVCASDFSGATGSSLVTNPINFNINAVTGSSNTYKEVWLALVPVPDTFNTAANGVDKIKILDNLELLDADTDTNILNKVRIAGSFAAKIILNPAGTAVQSIAMYNGSSWTTVPATTGASVNGLGGTIKDFGTGTTAQVSTAGTNKNLISQFRIELNTVPLAKYGFYVAVLISDASGVSKTTNSTPANPLMYKKVNAIGTTINWGVDLIPPAVTSQFTTTDYNTGLGGDHFRINWMFNETNGFQFKSFIQRDGESDLYDIAASNTVPINFTSPPLSSVDDFNNGSLLFSGVNSNSAVTTQVARTYRNGDPDKEASYKFYAFTRDNACNQKVLTTVASLQKPWLVGYGGDVSAAQGISFSIPTSLAQFSNDLKTSTPTSLTDKNSVFLSTYSSISATVDMPLRKQSKTSQYLINYQDLGVKPPSDSGNAKWFDYIYGLVKKNAAANIITKGGGQMTGNTSALAGIAPDAKGHVEITDSLSLLNTVCNSKTIIFIRGNLTIHPNLTVSGAGNGCMFVVSGNITIEKGGNVTNVGLNDPALANYDLIEAALITDGQFIVLADKQANTLKWDGLMLKGSLTSESVNLQRDINLNANQFQPAHVFYFDGRYREIFKTDLNYDKYSIREVGFSNN